MVLAAIQRPMAWLLNSCYGIYGGICRDCPGYCVNVQGGGG